MIHLFKIKDKLYIGFPKEYVEVEDVSFAYGFSDEIVFREVRYGRNSEHALKDNEVPTLVTSELEYFPHLPVSGVYINRQKMVKFFDTICKDIHSFKTFKKLCKKYTVFVEHI